MTMETGKEKSSKSQLKQKQRNAKKYHKKATNLLKEFEGLNITSTPSVCLFIGNGGMLCGQTRENLLELFTSYGVVADLVMLPKKSFALVQMQSIVCAEKAVNALEGHILNNCDNVKQPTSVPLYFQYLDTPDLHFLRKSAENESYPDEDVGEGLIEGLEIYREFIDEEYEKDLFDFFHRQCCDQEAGENVLKHRSVLHYGYKFLYGSNNIDKEKPMDEGIPRICQQLLDKMLTDGLIHEIPDQLTINQYRPGQGIPAHVDTHSAFEDGIFSLTLNSLVAMDFTNPEGRTKSVFLARRSLLAMKGESRYLWSHGITPRKHDIVFCKDPTQNTEDENAKHLTMRERGIRISLTFRKILRGECRCAFPTKCDSQNDDVTKKTWPVPLSQNEASSLEDELVYKVYDEIAEHFSDTRHSPWPRVKKFLCNLPNGSIVADVGCGNGKYLGVNNQLMMMGSDRSVNLASICEERGHQIMVSDCLTLPYRSSCFDGCICIAVIHHLSTEQRRLEAIQELVRITRVGGLILVYVWALEQDTEEENEGVLLGTDGTKILNPSYSIDNEKLEALDLETNKYSDSKESNDKQYIQVAEGRNTFQQQDLLVPWHLKNINPSQEEHVFHRFYHVFKRGELETLCRQLPNVEVRDLYLDCGNWCIVLQKT
ncbi:alkylated DNA repair protein alkB homolog 8-like isoform X2 [Clytia hemisphaerica]|uniref:tRNA (carboxymethyluridine(34)-5-O)-methyltransferase n=1 Tax=Clytia hemisphaerica TaxID=252671 RepID=A0A7M6DJR3_9CNID